MFKQLGISFLYARGDLKLREFNIVPHNRTNVQHQINQTKTTSCASKKNIFLVLPLFLLLYFSKNSKKHKNKKIKTKNTKHKIENLLKKNTKKNLPLFSFII